MSAFTIASMTSPRRPSLKLGTHSTSRFMTIMSLLPLPHQFSLFERRNAEIHRRKIRNLTIIRQIIDGKIGILARLDRAQPMLAANSAGAVDCRRDDRL